MQKTFKHAVSLSLLLFVFFVPAALGAGWSTSNYSDTGLPSASIERIVTNIAMWLLGIFGFIGVIGFVIAGIFYLTAAGDEKQSEKAKKAMTMSIIGVVVGLLGLIIINAADTLLNAGESSGGNSLFGF